MALTHDVVGSNPTTPMSISKFSQKQKRGGVPVCHSADGLFYVYAAEERVERLV